MAYSLYAYLKPEILEAGIPFWDQYFEANSWLKTPQPGDVNLFTHVKPRIENGTDRIIAYLDAVRAAGDLVTDFVSDTWDNPTPEKIRSLMIELGYTDLVERIRFE